VRNLFKINIFLRQFCNYTLFINKDLDSRGGFETVFAVLPADIPEEKIFYRPRFKIL